MKLYRGIIVVDMYFSKQTMSLDEQDTRSPRYKVEHVSPKGGKLELSREAFAQSQQNDLLVATIKVVQPGYVPAGVEVRARIGPEIFTANIPRDMLDKLQSDPAVTSIALASKLRSF